ncbi:predicted protein [Pyrenophora tritici-repentis Pt-1C-BFP]|uniref:Uncharacterized protein n=1 Tax=Pyrenophora tritici-repentis (strain Pt-1C-BFP) TaxID=426418 RepID=B2VW98_PYRTR|nr:uncharacterized protein PTRG_01460 [Pyrenophora tritici-repentis Pt-1C-BFP]EDU40898.1 predicted protein [Pyrenophora tritici-repentis Pt-1C-BFP]
MSAPQDKYVFGRKIKQPRSLPQHGAEGEEGRLRAIEATKRLFGALGGGKPIPFTTPPPVPHFLKKEFEQGMAEYGIDANNPATDEQRRRWLEIMDTGQQVVPSSSRGQDAAPEKDASREQDVSTRTRPNSPNMDFGGPLLPNTNNPAQSPWREDLFGPMLKEPRVASETGLPTIPWRWVTVPRPKFPGNTPGLQLILLNWLEVMEEFQRRLPHPQAFAVNPAFPLNMTHPTRKRPVSVSFYETTTNPHRELRFLGPGDATSIVYGEVDLFESKGQKRLRTLENYNPVGEGRWAFVHIEDRRSMQPGEGSPSFVLLAWPTSAVTSRSESLHTIYPKDTPLTTLPPIRPQPPGGSLRRLMSISQILDPEAQRKRLYEAIRSKSASELAEVDTSSNLPPAGSQKFVRTVIKLEKPGNTPLVEEYRVDMMVFGEWMDADNLPLRE